MRLTVIVLAALCAVLFASNADARPRHHHHKPSMNGQFAYLHKLASSACSDPVMRPCGQWNKNAKHDAFFSSSYPRHKKQRLTPGLSRVMAEGAGRIAKPIRYIAGRLICARNVNSALAERGIRGTGSALAFSFLHWGRPSTPVPGAVAVSARKGGGHVAIVSRVVNGQVYVWNPSPRGRGWQERLYRHHAIAFRVAGSESIF